MSIPVIVLIVFIIGVSSFRLIEISVADEVEKFNGGIVIYRAFQFSGKGNRAVC